MHERKTPHVNSTHRPSTISTKKPPIPSRRGTQQRTGRTSLTSVTNQQQITDEQKETQRRIAARAATAMAQVRKRQPRSFMFWGDKRRAVIKRYPDGTQEILVPQTLTPEQEQYEFPPRSRLLKKLANSTAERQRLHSLQHSNTIVAPNLSPPTLPSFDYTPSSTALSSSLHSHSFSKQSNVVISRPASVMEPDQSALAEWFSGKRNKEQQQKQTKRATGDNNTNTKEKAVMDWMTDVERSTSLLKKSSARSVNNNVSSNNIKQSSSSSKSAWQNIHDVNIHFKSEAGKRWASGSLGQNSLDHLSPPSEDSRKHYVRRRRLLKHGNKPWPAPTASLPKRTTTTASIYSTVGNHHHQHKHDVPLTTSSTTAVPVTSSGAYYSSSSHKVPRSSVSASPTSKSGMVQLVEMFHKTLQDQQARAHERMQQLEALLEEERSKRQDIQRTQQMTMSRLDTFMKKYQEQRTPPSPTLSLSAASSSPPASPSPGRKRKEETTRRPNLDAWMERISRLESSVENEAKSRQCLQQSVAQTVERVDALKRSVSRQAREHSTSRRELEKQINQAICNLSTLAQQRNR
ncbi:hypothetical protein BCR42DRAFT_430874 [Absidia repens]|uniref:Uncharacterized protein n=1 Tax=Absidia repens TaxID=90262 RepID=A0A1X2J094_9FUNG|nr:hypothetical protein BCR42DRAFT_430874 [Absidia repens]